MDLKLAGIWPLMLCACELIKSARKDEIQYFYAENIRNNRKIKLLGGRPGAWDLCITI
jgi:hypothetical protein